jgi:imidazolonepropionase-like amidohydrolase
VKVAIIGTSLVTAPRGGTVEPGRNADLVVLDANPLDDVENLHRINAVVRAGTHFSAAELDALKVRVSASAEDNR